MVPHLSADVVGGARQLACMDLAQDATAAAANIQGPGHRRLGGLIQKEADTMVLPGTGLRAGTWEVCWQSRNGRVMVSRDILRDTRKIYYMLHVINWIPQDAFDNN